MSVASLLFTAGFLSIIAGFMLILLSIFTGGKEERETRGFGIIFLGPIPIIFGGGRGRTKILTLLSFILFLVVFLFFFLPHLFG